MFWSLGHTLTHPDNIEVQPATEQDSFVLKLPDV
jgi:hypothetical protein